VRREAHFEEKIIFYKTKLKNLVMKVCWSLIVLAVCGFGLNIVGRPSPNFSNTTIKPIFIVLHCIGGDDPLATLLSSGVSAHYLVPVQNTSDLTAFQMVFDDPNSGLPFRAWHAGISAWNGLTELNNFSIGIEVHMPNYAFALTDPEHLDFMHFEAFQGRQIAALVELVQFLQARFGIPPQNVIGHSDIAPWTLQNRVVMQRKTDPGPSLPWECLARHGIGVFPVEEGGECVLWPIEKVQSALNAVGFALPQTGELDEATKLTLTAFSTLHWVPLKCSTSCNATLVQLYTCAMQQVLFALLKGDVVPQDGACVLMNIH
jgi:N-acetylmuramoyl-L-alanine amidase